jgi:hypothetical protein
VIEKDLNANPRHDGHVPALRWNETPAEDCAASVFGKRFCTLDRAGARDRAVLGDDQLEHNARVAFCARRIRHFRASFRHRRSQRGQLFGRLG